MRERVSIIYNFNISTFKNGLPVIIVPNLGTFTLTIYNEFRCRKCNKLLVKPSERGIAGAIKCPRCGYINKI